MKKFITILLVVFGLLFLLSSDTTQDKDKSVKIPVQTLKVVTVKDEYLWGLHSFHENRIEAVKDKDLIVAGQNSCTFLDEGFSIPNTVIDIAYTEKSVDGDIILANEIVANAVFTFCKEFIPQLNAANP